MRLRKKPIGTVFITATATFSIQSSKKLWSIISVRILRKKELKMLQNTKKLIAIASY